MKVKDFIKKLMQCNPEADILFSSDSEGNDIYSSCSIETDLAYDPEDIENVGFKELTPELAKMGYKEEDAIKNGISCIIIYPG
jgi:hypothetical protein